MTWHISFDMQGMMVIAEGGANGDEDGRDSSQPAHWLDGALTMKSSETEVGHCLSMKHRLHRSIIFFGPAALRGTQGESVFADSGPGQEQSSTLLIQTGLKYVLSRSYVDGLPEHLFLSTRDSQ